MQELSNLCPDLISPLKKNTQICPKTLTLPLQIHSWQVGICPTLRGLPVSGTAEVHLHATPPTSDPKKGSSFARSLGVIGPPQKKARQE